MNGAWVEFGWSLAWQLPALVAALAAIRVGLIGFGTRSVRTSRWEALRAERRARAVEDVYWHACRDDAAVHALYVGLRRMLNEVSLNVRQFTDASELAMSVLATNTALMKEELHDDNT